jgi:putative salt-induced outer membrane protein
MFVIASLTLLATAVTQLATPLAGQAQDMQTAAEAVQDDATDETLLPSAVSAVIDAALVSGDAASIDIVARFARQAHPRAADAIDRRIATWRNTAGLVALASAPVVSKAATHETLQSQTLLPSVTPLPLRWTGEGEIGAFTSSGNAPGIGFVGSVKLVLEGQNWRVNSLGRIDYQETANIVTRDQYRVSAEPNYKFSPRGYVFGLGQYEKDRFQGFRSRYSMSGGLGYSLFSESATKVNVKAGPAWRRTTANTGEQETILAGLASVDVNLKISPTLQFTQDANAYVDANGSTLYTLAALDTKLLGKLKARFSYMVQHETAPEPGRIATDATSRLTLVYGF